MNRDASVFKVLVVIGIVSGISGCASSAMNAINDKNIVIEGEDSRYVQFVDVNAYLDEAGVLVQAVARKRVGRRGYVPGHMDVVVISPDGVRDVIHGMGSWRWRTNMRMARFYHLLRQAPEPGSAIRIVHHVDH